MSIFPVTKFPSFPDLYLVFQIMNKNLPQPCTHKPHIISFTFSFFSYLSNPKSTSLFFIMYSIFIKDDSVKSLSKCLVCLFLHKVVGILMLLLCIFQVFETTYAPFLMRPWVRAVVIVVFIFWLCASVAMVPHIEIGLEEELSMPDDSYVLKYFEVSALLRCLFRSL